eukprot:6035955-Pyramimonas_sp.AAC.1
MVAGAGARPTPQGSTVAVITLGLGNFENNPRCSGSTMPTENTRSHRSPLSSDDYHGARRQCHHRCACCRR